MIKQPTESEIRVVLSKLKLRTDLSEPDLEKAIEKQAARIVEGARTLRHFDKRGFLERQRPVAKKQLEPIKKMLLELSKYLSETKFDPAALSALDDAGFFDEEFEYASVDEKSNENSKLNYSCLSVANRYSYLAERIQVDSPRGQPPKTEARAVANLAYDAFMELTGGRGTAMQNGDRSNHTPLGILTRDIFVLFDIKDSASSMIDWVCKARAKKEKRLNEEEKHINRSKIAD